MKSPCLSCHRLYMDKSDPACTDCANRLRYVGALGDMTYSVPDRLCDYRRGAKPPTIKEPVEMDAQPIEQKPLAAPQPDKKVCRRSTCIHGGAPQPLSNFDNNFTMPDNKSWHCKDCRRDMQRARSAKKICPSTEVPVGTRICYNSTCAHKLAPQPLENFIFRARYCNDCRTKKEKPPKKSKIKMKKAVQVKASRKIAVVDQGIKSAGTPVSAFEGLADLFSGQKYFSVLDRARDAGKTQGDRFMMTIKEAQARTAELEQELCAGISHEIARFAVETGLSPSSITVDMMDVRALGDKRPRYVVSSVQVKVTL
jgi:hypothetical protein